MGYSSYWLGRFCPKDFQVGLGPPSHIFYFTPTLFLQYVKAISGFCAWDGRGKKWNFDLWFSYLDRFVLIKMANTYCINYVKVKSWDFNVAIFFYCTKKSQKWMPFSPFFSFTLHFFLFPFPSPILPLFSFSFVAYILISLITFITMSTSCPLDWSSFFSIST